MPLEKAMFMAVGTHYSQNILLGMRGCSLVTVDSEGFRLGYLVDTVAGKVALTYGVFKKTRKKT